MSAAFATPEDFPAGQNNTDDQLICVGGGPNSEQQASRTATPMPFLPAARSNFPADQVKDDAQVRHVGGGLNSEQVTHTTPPISTAPARPTPPKTNGRALDLAEPTLGLSADILDDLERVRIASENRLRYLTRTEVDSDGIARGLGLPEDYPAALRLKGLIKQFALSEELEILALQRRMRGHPLGPWILRQKGIGLKQGARLLAAIGDPYWNDKDDRPRRVSDLWSYCGYGDATKQVRRRGERISWSPTARMRAHLVAAKIVETGRGGPYRKVYDATRTKYAGAIHQTECRRCGPAGKPAQPGSPLSAGHQHARALRAVAKEVLRDLWREAKRIHEDPAF